VSEWRVIQGDCLEVMRGMDANSVDSIVTDPPAGIAFMSKSWDGATMPTEYTHEYLSRSYDAVIVLLDDSPDELDREILMARKAALETLIEAEERGASNE